MDFQVTLQEGTPPSHQILSHLFKNRLEDKKPVILFLGGSSGEGKSHGALKLMEVVFPEETKDEDTFIDKQIIYNPSEYKDKLEWILYAKEASDKHVLIFMEARELVKSKLWFSIVNQCIGDVNAMSRAVKPLMFVMCSQSVGDVDKDTRKTISFYGICARPFKRNTRLDLYKVYIKPYINNPATMMRKLKGKILNKDGTSDWWSLRKFVLSKPTKALSDKFDFIDKKIKSGIILEKLQRLDKAIMRDNPKMGKLDRLVEIMTKNIEMRNIYLKRVKGGKMRINQDQIGLLKETYSLNMFEIAELEKRINDKILEGVVKIGKQV